MGGLLPAGTAAGLDGGLAVLGPAGLDGGLDGGVLVGGFLEGGAFGGAFLGGALDGLLVVVREGGMCPAGLTLAWLDGKVSAGLILVQSG